METENTPPRHETTAEPVSEETAPPLPDDPRIPKPDDAEPTRSKELGGAAPAVGPGPP
jgi:hypothetical protein